MLSPSTAVPASGKLKGGGAGRWGSTQPFLEGKEQGEVSILEGYSWEADSMGTSRRSEAE